MSSSSSTTAAALRLAILLSLFAFVNFADAAATNVTVKLTKSGPVKADINADCTVAKETAFPDSAAGWSFTTAAGLQITPLDFCVKVTKNTACSKNNTPTPQKITFAPTIKVDTLSVSLPAKDAATCARWSACEILAELNKKSGLKLKDLAQAKIGGKISVIGVASADAKSPADVTTTLAGSSVSALVPATAYSVKSGAVEGSLVVIRNNLLCTGTTCHPTISSFSLKEVAETKSVNITNSEAVIPTCAALEANATTAVKEGVATLFYYKSDKTEQQLNVAVEIPSFAVIDDPSKPTTSTTPPPTSAPTNAETESTSAAVPVGCQIAASFALFASSLFL